MEILIILIENSTFLSTFNILKLALINKELNNYSKNILIKRKCLLECFVKLKANRALSYFNGTFLPNSLIKGMTYLDWKDKYLGGTDYIDGILDSDLKSSLNFGIDPYKRPFVVIRYKKLLSQKIDCLTIFQRYTDTKSCWVKHENTNDCILLKNTSTSLNTEEKNLLIKNIINLLIEKQIIYKYYPEDFSNEYQYLNCDSILY